MSKQPSFEERMRILRYTLLIAALLPKRLAFGAEDCSQKPNQLEINQCVQQSFDQADAALQKAYNSLLKKLPLEAAKQLRDAQRGWVIYKDNWCQFQSAMVTGSMRSAVLGTCLRELTNAQLEKLNYQNTCMEDVDCSPKL